MAYCYSTLPVLDRILINVPPNLWSVEILARTETLVKAKTCSFNGSLVLNAYKIGNDCYDVVFEIWPHIGGGTKLGKTVKFTTTGTWVDQWIEKAQNTVLNRK